MFNCNEKHLNKDVNKLHGTKRDIEDKDRTSYKSVEKTDRLSNMIIKLCRELAGTISKNKNEERG